MQQNTSNAHNKENECITNIYRNCIQRHQQRTEKMPEGQNSFEYFGVSFYTISQPFNNVLYYVLIYLYSNCVSRATLLSIHNNIKRNVRQ